MTQLTKLSTLGLGTVLSYPIVSILFQSSLNRVKRGITQSTAFVKQSSGAVFKKGMTQGAFDLHVKSLRHPNNKKQLKE